MYDTYSRSDVLRGARLLTLCFITAIKSIHERYATSKLVLPLAHARYSLLEKLGSVIPFRSLCLPEDEAAAG